MSIPSESLIKTLQLLAIFLLVGFYYAWWQLLIFIGLIIALVGWRKKFLATHWMIVIGYLIVLFNGLYFVVSAGA